MTPFDPATTALVVIDLQTGIVQGDKGPHAADAVVAAASGLAVRFRAAGAPVFLVHVGWRSDAERPSGAVDRPMPIPPGGTPAHWMALVDGLEQPGDIVVLKHHWGAFTGTDLDLQLRRRGIRTIVLAGIATNFGVESTARAAWELSYDVVVVEDACTSRSAALHAFAIAHILPQIARVVTAAQISLD